MPDIKTLSAIETVKILESRNLGNILNTIEEQEVEFKPKKPYVFDDVKNILPVAELAKDASSFANADGGVIICGITNKRVGDQDIADKLELFPEADFYKPQDIIGRIKLTVYPTIENISVKWYPSEEPGLGIGAIIIPKQNDYKKHFVVNICPAGDGRLSGVYFGIAIRKGNHPEWLEMKDMKFLRQMIPSDTEELFIEIKSDIRDIKDNMGKTTSLDRNKKLQQRMEGEI